MDIRIVEAIPHQAHELTQIAIKAKSHWGYTPEQMALWIPEFLTISPDYITNQHVWVALSDNGDVAGFAAIEEHDDGAILEHLWMLPDYMGQGIGKRLFLHAASIFPEFTFTSDPHADEFYKHMGAVKIGEYESMLQGRMLTHFKYVAKS